MSLFKLSKSNIAVINPLFENITDTLVLSCLQGYMGQAWTDDLVAPQSAQIITADFCFFAGKPNAELVNHCPESYDSDSIIMIPGNDSWAALIEKNYEGRAGKFTRYAIKPKTSPFDIPILNQYISQIPPSYQLKRFDSDLYNQSKLNSWSEDFCSQFDSYDLFNKYGLGVAVTCEDKLVAGASSYTIFDKGIEIEVDTQFDHRRKGLALACSAKLILECLEKNIYPNWDAANLASVALAEKLGYEFSHEYAAYEITDFDNHKKSSSAASSL